MFKNTNVLVTGGAGFVGVNLIKRLLDVGANVSATLHIKPVVVKDERIRYTQAEDYTAGELNDPFDVVPAARWVDGSQWHALTFLGSTWGRRDVRQPTDRWREWFQKVAAKEGAVTLDMGPNWNPNAGPIGAIAEAQAQRFKEIARP